jgi:hypothetical protein
MLRPFLLCAQCRSGCSDWYGGGMESQSSHEIGEFWKTATVA